MHRGLQLFFCLIVLALPSLAGAADWRWFADFTEASSSELAEVHVQLHSAGAFAGVQGVPVRDATLELDEFSLHITEGVVYREPPVDGVVFGALFVGRAEASYAPESPRARGDLNRFFGVEALDAEPVGHAYIFSLDGGSLLDQLGVEGEPSVPFTAADESECCKKAMRQEGTRFTHAFLDREGAARGASYVIFAPDSIRQGGSPDAHLLFALDPTRQSEIELSVFGHKEAIRDPRAQALLDRYPHYKYLFWPVTTDRANGSVYTSPADLKRYETRIRVGKGETKIREEATVELIPSEPVSMLRFALTARLQVESVSGPGGEALPFLQWEYLGDHPNFDQHLLIATGKPLEPGKSFTIRVVSSGPLLEGRLGSTALADEDHWYPRLDVPHRAIFETRLEVPKNLRAVGAGQLLSETVEDGRRLYHYRTSYPSERSSFYVGNFEIYEEQADDTTIELFFDSYRDEIAAAATGPGGDPDIITTERPQATAREIANAVRIYNQLLGQPLEVEQLRVVTTPTFHGRGFEGIILLSKYGGTTSADSAADLFRAHEVAHQWWGNMVETLHWPEDRWLSEAFAEYSAMEYMLYRFRKPEKVRKLIREQWWQPLFKVSDVRVKTLSGEKTRVKRSELAPLIAGGGNVYTKGPLVLHSLRYLFKVTEKGDDAFWELLEDFLGRYKYGQAGTQDFMTLAEQHMQGNLAWFWDQWVFGTEIPTIRWSHELKRNEEGNWLLTVEAEQEHTEFIMPVPVYVHMKGGKTLDTPLIFRGKQATASTVLREKPKNVTLNDNYEALARIKN
jgi:hypothetical protein